jgi:hypothetical protein
MLRSLLLLAPLAGAAIVVGAIIVLGRLAREDLDAKLTLPFAAIECQPPPGLSASQFLAEVQFLARSPDRLRLDAPGLEERLRQAFASHPWVETVEEVGIEPGRARVRLRHRTPVLAVPWGGADGPYRAVDRFAVLLPISAMRMRLPVLDAAVRVPADQSGQPWRDPEMRIEKVACRDGDFWLVTPSGRIHWGSGAGHEKPGEPVAKEKLQRLYTVDRVGGDGLDLTHSQQPIEPN